MEIKIISKKSFLAFWTLRYFLNEIKYAPKSNEDYIFLHTINPTGSYREKTLQLSLTDSMDVGAQLRFFLEDRVIRRLIGLADSILSRHKITSVTIYNSNLLDAESEVFFNILISIFKVKIIYSDKLDHCFSKKAEDLFLKEEEINKNITLGNVDYLYNLAEEYLCVGNHWAIERLVEFMPVSDTKTKVSLARLNAVSAVQANNFFKAKFYYQQWKDVGDLDDKIKANYGLSMLYLRFLPDDFKDIEYAEKLLEDAYKNARVSKKENEVGKIFNRNGYALVLFKKGKIQEAIELLEWAVGKLNNIPSKVALMHKSVILYNISQCYSITGEKEKAIEILSTLIQLDPFYPEYHLEIAKNYIESSNFDKAITTLEKAINIDKYIPEAYNQLAFCHLQVNNLVLALKAYEQAYRISPQDENTIYGISFCLAIKEKYEDIIEFLSPKIQLLRFDEFFDDINIVYAEALSFIHTNKEAKTFLLNQYPHGQSYIPKNVASCLSLLN